MGRPPKFTSEEILDAAGGAVLERGRGVAVGEIAARLGVSEGAVFYRFATREALLGELWARAVERFQRGFLEALRLPDPDAAAAAAAAHIPAFCRASPEDAAAMRLFRQEQLAAAVEGQLAERVAAINDQAIEGLQALALRRFGDAGADRVALASTACLESPYGLVRPYLGTSREIPAWLDRAAGAAAIAILAVGDEPEAAA